MDALRKRRLILVLAGAAVLAAVAIVVLVPRHAPPPPLAGMVRQTEIRIAPEITGRLTSVAVRAGQAVRKGDALGSARQSRARRHRSARPRRRRPAPRPNGPTSMPACVTKNGRSSREASRRPRPTCCWPSRRMRAPSPWRRGTSPASRSSTRATPRWPRRRADLDLKRAQLAAAHAGPTAEERALADARVALAEATVADLQAKLDKTRLVAPVDGVVGILVAEPGEVVPVGKPVLTLEVGQREMVRLHPARGRAGRALTVGSTRHADDRRWPADRGARHASCGRSASSRPGVPRAPSATTISTASACGSIRSPAEDKLQPGMTVWLAGTS